jgi:hypothetical protein
MTAPEPTKIELTFECRCFAENAKDGDTVKTWRSRAIPAHTDATGKFVMPRPVIPCPECGRDDRVRSTSTDTERW